MTENNSTMATENVEKRSKRGSWIWFILNVILFPAPAHFTLLRIKEQNLGKNIQHLGITLLLFLLLVTAALLQIFNPGVGRFWMLIPILPGFVVLYSNWSLRYTFSPVNIKPPVKTQMLFLGGCVLLFLILNVIPQLNLIELDQKAANLYRGWLLDLPFWQDLVIIVASLFLLFAGYIINSSTGVSINRALILYACFLVIFYEIVLVLFLATSRLKVQGGFWMCLTAGLLGAILALDYWDAKTIGQYVRRYFFLTCTKGFTFIFLWFCFLGLPQKSASVFSEFHFNKVSPPPVRIPPRYLVLDHEDHFKSAHTATRRLRALSTKTFLDNFGGTPDEYTRIFSENIKAMLPTDADVFQLSELIRNSKLNSTDMDFGSVPLFRPVESGWDVMLTALLTQGSIAKEDIDKHIVGFKKILPKTSKGELPGIDTLFAAHYVALATETTVNFIVPEYQHIEHLVAHNLSPVILLRLAGKKGWAALLHIDKKAGLAWFRIETRSKIKESIQLLFDSNKHRSHRDEIISRSIMPLSLDYFRNALELNASPIIVFSKSGLANEFPDWVSRENLDAVGNAVGVGSGKQRIKTPVPPSATADPFLNYANYHLTVAWIKSMLQPREYRDNLFAKPDDSPAVSGIDLLTGIQSLLRDISPLYESDRLDIADLLVRHNHVTAMPELFIELAAPKPVLSDLIGCQKAFLIGRRLHLLGYLKEAHEYLELAFLRHPFFAEYELWYHISKIKLHLPRSPLLSPLNQEPSMALYYKTIVDLENENSENALKRLKKVVEKDSHDSLANHLLSKYFDQPLNTRHFFSTPEGL